MQYFPNLDHLRTKGQVLREVAREQDIALRVHVDIPHPIKHRTRCAIGPEVISVGVDFNHKDIGKAIVGGQDICSQKIGFTKPAGNMSIAIGIDRHGPGVCIRVLLYLVLMALLTRLI